jgi:DNA modification methylase
MREKYEALKHGRTFLGLELKPEYYRTAIKNLERVLLEQTQQRLL